MDWKTCCKERIVKEVSLDNELISSLIKSSENKFLSQRKLKLDIVTASSKISLSYDSLRELLEAIALKNGFKVYNHECYTSFLKEILKESSIGDDFNEVRKIRNAVNYYGKEINTNEAKSVINNIESLRKKLLEFI